MWMIHVDGSSNNKGSGVGLILVNQEGIVVKSHSLSHSRLLTTKSSRQPFPAYYWQKTSMPPGSNSLHIHSWSSLISKRSMMPKMSYSLLTYWSFSPRPRWKCPAEWSTNISGNHRSVIQETLSQPSVSLEMGTTSETNVINACSSWIASIIKYIELGEEPTDASSYSVIEGKLYRWGFSIPLLKCTEGDKRDYVLAEIHEGICGQHLDNGT